MQQLLIAEAKLAENNCCGARGAPLQRERIVVIGSCYKNRVESKQFINCYVSNVNGVFNPVSLYSEFAAPHHRA